MNRIIIGLLVGLIVIGSLVLGEWYALIFLCLLVLLAQHEHGALSRKLYARSYGWWTMSLITVGSLCFATLAWMLFRNRGQFDSAAFLPSLIICAVIYLLLRILNLYNQTRPSLVRELLDHILYVPLATGLAYWICIKDGGYSYSPLLGIIMLIWTADVGAYYFGKNLGQHKLFPSVSPNKTWEGSLGGLFVTLVMSQLLCNFLLDLSRWEWLLVAAITWLGSSYGDLIESQYKRLADVKDSGRLLGGHGGVLDRFDAFFGAIPLVACYLYLMMRYSLTGG